MVVIVGLGNPSKEYLNTRHNIGFKVIDFLANKYEIKLEELIDNALVGKGKINNKEVLLVKPLTYMNSSGEAVKSICSRFTVDEKEDLIIIYDDISLALGNFRVRKKGSAGGHNGIKNIIELLGHDTFKRIKIGIGNKPENLNLIDFVLGEFLEDEINILNENMEKIDSCLNLIFNEGIDKTMSLYNYKSK